jgi:hypothetical protein
LAKFDPRQATGEEDETGTGYNMIQLSSRLGLIPFAVNLQPTNRAESVNDDASWFATSRAQPKEQR